MGKFQAGENVAYQGCTGVIKRVYESNGMNAGWYDVVIFTISGAIAVTRIPGKWLHPVELARDSSREQVPKAQSIDVAKDVANRGRANEGISGPQTNG